MSDIIVLNPLTHKVLVVQAIQQILGNNSGLLKARQIFTLASANGTPQRYCFTLPILQCIRNPEAHESVPQKRINILDAGVEKSGHYGGIIPVQQSIIFIDGEPVIDLQNKFVIKRILIRQTEGVTDKPDKPNWPLRAAQREHHLGSQLPALGVDYGLVMQEQTTYLHMNRVPGLPLQHYVVKSKLQVEQFLLLACALLEQIPPQLHRPIPHGKHKGKITIHCDIKPDNIHGEWNPDTRTWRVVLLDLGLAKTTEPGKAYLSKFERGNNMVMTKAMLEACMSGNLIPYSEKSDLYALFMVIALLAGVTGRMHIRHSDPLMCDLDNPDLTGIFKDIMCEQNLKLQLTQLVRLMLTAADSLSIKDQILAGFKDALIAVQNQKPVTVPATVLAQTTKAGHLKRWVELPRFLQGGNPRPGDEEEIADWLKEYKLLLSFMSPEELDAFNLMRSQNEVKITNLYIHDILRFGFFTEYTIATSASLLAQHHKNITLFKSRACDEQWAARFNELLKKIPFQYHDEHKEFCEQLAAFKKYTDLISSDTRQSPLLNYLGEELELQLAMDYSNWFENLPQFLSIFNRQCCYYFEIDSIVQQTRTIAPLKPNLQDVFSSWSIQLETEALKKILIYNCKEYFSKRHELVKTLSTLQLEQLAFFNDAPQMKISPYRLAKIHTLIKDFDIAKETDVDDLNHRLEVSLKLLRLKCYIIEPCIVPFLTSEPLVMEHVRKSFIELLLQDANPEEFSNKLDRLYLYIESLLSIYDFYMQVTGNNNKNQLTHVVLAIASLMQDTLNYEQCFAFKKLVNNRVNWEFLHRLDSSLSHIVHGSNPAKNMLILEEFKRYWAYPSRYSPLTKPAPSVATVSRQSFFEDRPPPKNEAAGKPGLIFAMSS